MEYPKVTPQDVENAITGETYTVLPDGRTTVCQLTLYNEFTVEGYSACVCKENFNQELGQKYSRERAVDKVWPLLGFLLAEKLYRERISSGPVEQVPEAGIQVGDQVCFYEVQEGKASGPMVAFVTRINENGSLNLSVFAPNGEVHPRCTRLVEEGIPDDLRYFVRRK